MSQHMTWQQRLRNDISPPFLCFFVLQAAFLLFCVLHPVAEIGMVDTIHQIGGMIEKEKGVRHKLLT